MHRELPPSFPTLRASDPFGIEPCGARGAKGAAVAPFFERIDGDEAQFGQIEHILDEAIAVVEPWEVRVEIVAQIVIADARPDGKGAARKSGHRKSVV